MTSGPTHQKMAADIWAVADLLRGDYKRHEYGQVILPFTVLRRLDAVMAPTREAVRARDAALSMQNKEKLLEKTARLPFYNVSKQDFTTIASDAAQVAKNLRDYINGFSANVREILARFDFDNQITRLAEAKLLYQVVGRFAEMQDLDKLSNHDMGYVFEHLIRKFAEDSNETAGEHFTPREVIELMVNLLIAPDDGHDHRRGPGHQHPRPGLRHRRHAHHRRGPHQVHQPGRRGLPVRPGAQRRVVGGLRVGHAAARASAARIDFGNSFSNDGYPGRKFDYMLANPPFGVEWKKVKDEVEDEAETRLRGPVRRGPAADQRRVVPVPAAHDLEDEPGRGQGHPAGDRLQRLPAVHRRGRVGRVGDPPVDPGERLAGRHRRAAGPALLQHRHLDVLLDPVQPEGRSAARQGDPAGRPRPVGEDAQVPGRQAQADQRRADQAHHRAVRERAGGRGGSGASGPRRR